VLCLEGEMGLPTVPMTVSLGWNEGPIWYTHVAPERTRWQSVGIARSAVTTSRRADAEEGEWATRRSRAQFERRGRSAVTCLPDAHVMTKRSLVGIAGILDDCLSVYAVVKLVRWC
jgi:hypothetical protein